jgi:hypothetical protein
MLSCATFPFGSVELTASATKHQNHCALGLLIQRAVALIQEDSINNAVQASPVAMSTYVPV